MASVSIYIHVPFCKHRCGYCDFNTYAGLNALIPSYTLSICQEIEILSANRKNNFSIGTIYFGGGTPSLLSNDDINRVLATIKQNFHLMTSPEISLEANPGTVTEEYLAHLQSSGVNRLSLGMQSASQSELRLLERQHSFDDVVNAVNWSRAAGINNINLDLIFGLPHQRLNDWMVSLEAALLLHPEHLSLYPLTIEEGTPLHQKMETGLFTEPDQDLVADMYEAASERLDGVGFRQYEISNWALKYQNGESYSCKHNLQYWLTYPYLGIGAGAHGFIDHMRTVNIPIPGDYINKLNNPIFTTKATFPHTPVTQQIVPLDIDTEISETMLMGLRLVEEGVSDKNFQERYGISLLEQFAPQIELLTSSGLLEWVADEGKILRLTKKGRLLGNQVFREFI